MVRARRQVDGLKQLAREVFDEGKEVEELNEDLDDNRNSKRFKIDYEPRGKNVATTSTSGMQPTQSC